MKHFRILALIGVAALGCDDEPVAPPDRPDTSDQRAAAVAPLTCTKTWASATGGLWADPSRWSPGGVPGPGDDVCISAAGAYDVSATQQIEVGSLQIGGPGATVEFDFDAPFGLGIVADDEIAVHAGSSLTVHSEGEARLSAHALYNYGTTAISNSCACGGAVALIEVGSMFNLGRMELDAPMTIAGDDWFNLQASVVITGGTGSIEYESSGGIFQFGTILGSTNILTEIFGWYGGVLGEIGPAEAVVRVTGGYLLLANDPAFPAVEGRIEAVSADSALHVAGDVAPGMYVEIQVLQDDTLVLESLAPGPFVNDGTLSIALTGLSVIEANHIVNNSLLKLNGTGSLELNAGLLVNRGQITNFGSDIVVADAGSVIRNHGSITSSPNAATLTMRAGTELVSYAGSDIGGSNDSLSVVLEGGTLRGEGRFGNVVSVGGSVQPGLLSGTLTVRSLTLDAASEFVLNAPLTPASSYGDLLVDGQITYGGVFRMQSLPGYPAGACGDVFTAIRHPSGAASGSFAAFNLPLRPATGWRPARTADSLMLAGYDPSARRISVTRSALGLAEGGPARDYQVCLGGTPPRADVTVTPVSATGDALLPAPIVFDRQSWMLPKTVTVEAWDDDIVEGVHYDTITHTLSSAHPLYDTLGVRPILVAIEDNNGNADLELTVDSAPTAASVGGTIEITYRVSDVGFTLSTGSTLTIEASGTAGTTFQSATGAACVADTAQTVVCDVPGMLRNESVTVTVVWNATGAGTATLDAVIAGEQLDPVPGNDAVVTNVVVN